MEIAPIIFPFDTILIVLSVFSWSFFVSHPFSFALSYGVSVITFAIQSYDPPAALANQVTAALARRTEAQYGQTTQIR